MKLRIAIFAVIATLAIGASAKTKVACVGNSITYGFLVDNRETNAYPFVLQRMLGDDYEVGNFGKSRATLLEKGHFPYIEQPEYKAALEFKPDVVLIHLGVNDTDPRNWPNYNSEFVGDYLRLIQSFRDVNPNVRVLVAKLTPLSAKHFRFRSGTRDWRLQAQTLIEEVAKQAGAELIDFNAPFRDRQDLMPDGIHPNVEGARLLAETARQAITGQYGGLKLPYIYTSGMVMQRNTPLRIQGTANAHAPITLTLAGRKYTTRANNIGQWHVTTAPLATGGPYTMEVSDGSRTITLTDILAGELWLASGQSNMEFHLDWSVGGKDAVAQSNNPNIRFFNMVPRALTNNVEWPDSVIQATDSLNHFLPAKWESVNPENAGQLSAIAYYFARELNDSLQVPIGVISNAIGGSTLESWMDINKLEEMMPEILLNWQKNDYVQPWAQGRAIKNAGTHRHPYEPSYLFASAIRPLEGLGLAGVLWYQGESNAHNIEIHEALFPAWVDNWRTHFNNSKLPVCFVQLSSIDRASWPQFRDSQRRMADQLADVYMAVSSDLGDSLDVHPRNKRPVAHRLARQTLKNIYGYNVENQGPAPLSATASKGSVTLKFSHADGLTTADGAAPRTFEIAQYRGTFLPAEAVINPADNSITLTNMEIEKPKYVRYAWQPFTRANLINSDSIPASTFEIEVDNSADFEIEPGLEYGVSAPAAGMLSGVLVAAGGCNFPTADPFAPGATKKCYKGIYTANPTTMQWQRAGSLPTPLAYAAFASTPQAIYAAGGTDGDGNPLKSIIKITLNAQGDAVAEIVGKLPVAIDNAAAAIADGKMYVVGGNVNGTPSRGVYVVNLADMSVAKAPDMPGNPRVQPAVAAADGKLYVWGGFAPRHGKHEPTLELEGLVFNPSTRKWTKTAVVTDATGTPLALGGGTACTLSDGRIALAGGVNKDVFLAALQNQPADYLAHPAEWYRFNPNIIIFNPATGATSVAVSDSQLARAGAVAVSGPNNDIYLIGGEIKPRVRTAETAHISL